MKTSSYIVTRSIKKNKKKKKLQLPSLVFDENSEAYKTSVEIQVLLNEYKLLLIGYKSRENRPTYSVSDRKNKDKIIISNALKRSAFAKRSLKKKKLHIIEETFVSK